jgi:translocation protein SEC63
MKKEVEDKKKTAAASSKTAIKAKEEESESCSEVEAEDEVELDESDDGEAEAANNDGSLPEKDDDQLEKLQSDVAMRRQRLLEGKSQFSHSVYCPFYPEDKQEYWWAYITDRKQQMLLTAPYHITNLVEHEEIQLKFTAPFKPGFYTFAVCLRSDSYFGFDQMKDIKVYSG